MSHFTSEQLPNGSPAIVDEPHAPLNADAGVGVDEPEVLPLPVDDEPVDEDPVVDVLPAGPLVSDGAVGPNSLEVCSNAQPVARADAINRLIREKFFMMPLQFCNGTHSSDMCLRSGRSEFSGNRGERLTCCRIKARTPFTRQNR